MPILMLTAADRLDDKASGFGLGADDYLTKPFELRELVLRLRALDRRRAHSRPPVREIAGLRLDPFRREVYRDGRYVALTRKQFAVLEVLVAADGGVVSAEELLERAWDENADPFTNAVRITVSALRKRLGEPWVIATVPGVGYRIDTEPDDDVTDGRAWTRAPGLSVRLKLTLSYAGFLMLAGALLLAAVWLFLLRYVPDRAFLVDADAPCPAPSHPLRPPARLRSRRPPRSWCSCWCSACSGGWFARRPHARAAEPHHRRHPHGRGRIALPPDRAGRPPRRVPRARRRASTRMLARLEAHVAEQQTVRGQRVPRAAHAAGDHTDPARGRPQRPEPRQRRARRTPPRRQRPGDRADRSVARCSAAPTSDPSPASTSTCPSSPRKPPRHSCRSPRSTASPSRPPATSPPTIGSHALLLQMTTNLLHNADRPQPARTRHRAGHHRPRPWTRRAHRREHRRGAHAPAGLDAHRTVPARHRTHTHATTRASASAWPSSRASREAHDGTLAIVPRPDGGLRVTVRLPAARRRGRPDRPRRRPRAAGRRAAARPPAIP